MNIKKTDMEEKINKAAILKDKPRGTKLYTILSDSECFLNEASEDSIYIDIDNRERFWCLSAYGSTYSFPNGCVLLFPSKEMRDWSKFAWKKGDVLINSSGFQCIFKEWASDDYTKFNGCYSNSRDGYEDVSNAKTAKFVKLDNNIAYGYVREIERELGGKLNRETLEVEKAQSFKDGDIVALVVRKCTHIAIFQSRQEKYIGFHAVLCQNDELLLEEPFREDDGDIELRPATDSEKQQLFEALAKEGKAWDAEKRMIVDLKPKVELKPFDKVVVRCSEADRWSIDFFSYKAPNGYICTGDAWFGYCLPYNEETAKLIGTTKDMEV